MSSHFGKRSKVIRVFSLVIIATVFLMISACATVPITERKALHLVSDSDLVSMSFQEYQQVLNKSKLSEDPEKVQMVKTVGANLARSAEEILRERGIASDIRYYKWEFNLIEDDKVVNAWCMPGGKVAVYTGLLPITQDENGLAVVVGHEIAHAIAKHGNERMSQGLLQHMGGVALSVALSSKPAATSSLFLAVYGVTSTVGVILPYSRVQEYEADRIGLILMAKAGYDPREAIPFWKRMKKKSGPRPPEFLSTHPAPESRIKEIESLIPEAMRYYRAPGKHQ